MANPILNNIPAYVDETKEELIAKAVLGGNTAKMLNLMVGVKTPTALHLLDTDVTLQDGTSCGFNAVGDQTISQRVLTPAILKVNMEYCEKNFLGTYAAHQLRIAAGSETLPYEQKFIDEVVKSVNAKVESLLFSGDSDNGAEFDGLIKILNADGAEKVQRKSTVYETVKAVYAALPETELLKNDTVIMVSPSDFRTFIQELVAANLYHFEPSDKSGEYMLPGTDCKVISVAGLAGTDTIIAGSLSGIYYGTDMSGDEEKFDFWYSKDDQIFKLAIEFVAGVQVAYPDMYVIAQ